MKEKKYGYYRSKIHSYKYTVSSLKITQRKINDVVFFYFFNDVELPYFVPSPNKRKTKKIKERKQTQKYDIIPLVCVSTQAKWIKTKSYLIIF